MNDYPATVLALGFDPDKVMAEKPDRDFDSLSNNTYIRNYSVLVLGDPIKYQRLDQVDLRLAAMDQGEVLLRLGQSAQMQLLLLLLSHS